MNKINNKNRLFAGILALATAASLNCFLYTPKRNPATYARPQPATHVYAPSVEWSETSFGVGLGNCIDLLVHDAEIRFAKQLEVKLESITPLRSSKGSLDAMLLDSFITSTKPIITDKDIYPSGDYLLIKGAICLKPYGLAEAGEYMVGYSIIYSNNLSKSFRNKITVNR